MARHADGGEDRARRPLVLRVGLVLVFFLGLAACAALLTLARWSTVAPAGLNEASAAFAEAWARAGAGDPWITIDDGGDVRVDDTLRLPRPVELEALHLLAWAPAEQRLVRVDFPFWFVRMKLSAAMNLGTMVTLVAGDWGDVELRVTEEELEAFGPGIVLDHTGSDGGRVMLWTD